MASACVNNVTLPHSFSDPSSDPNPNDFIDFEFHLNDPVGMLTADELFSGGKLVPLHFARPSDPGPESFPNDIREPETPLRPVTKADLVGSRSDHFALSPKAPTCSIRWRELLRRKRQQQTKPDPGSKTQNPNPNLKSNRRVSESDEPHLHRHSLDSEHMPNQNPILLNRNPPKNQNRVQSTKPVPATPQALVDSPRMNASGKVVFNGLGRSSSSPSTCGARAKQHNRAGMERSYSASVRVTPVLNVPVSSLRGGSKGFGFGQLFSGSGSKSAGSHKK